MVDGSPTLEVGFEIGTGASFEALQQLQNAMNSTEAKVMADAAKIERSTSGMVKLGGATAEVKAFGNAYTREVERLARSTRFAESAAEGMIKKLDWQAMTIGKNSQEIRNMRVEQRALAAESLGLTDVAERLRAASAELNRLEDGANGMGKASNRTGFAMQNLGYQVQDFAVQTAGGTSAIRAFSQQMPQAIGAIQMMIGGTGRLATFLTGPWGMALVTAATVAAAFAGKLFETEKAADASADANETLAEKLDLARHSFEEVIAASREYNREQEKARVTTLAAAKASVEAAKANLQEAMSIRQKLAASLSASLETERANTGQGSVPGLVGAVAGIRTAGVREEIAANEAALRSLKTTAVNAVNEVAGIQAKIATDPSFRIEQEYLAKRADAAKRYAGDVDALTDAYTRLNAEEKAALEAANKTEKTRSGRSDRSSERRAERLARESDAIGAQVRNLYDLADAYGVSGAAALVAEARVKAESEAIKKRGDIEAFVSREVQENIAQRVADAAKANAATRDQITAQLAANDAVAAGLIPAEKAAEFVQDRIADLPLLAAIEAAQQRGLANEADRATQALLDQKAAREELKRAAATDRFNQATAKGDDRLAMLRRELELVNATETARGRELALLEAQQQAQAQGWDAGQIARYVAQQMEAYDAAQALNAIYQDQNDQLNYMADTWSLIARNVQEAGTGMAQAFGEAGRALGGLASIYANYRANQEAAKAAREAIMRADITDAQRQRELARNQLAISNAQVGMYGDLASAAQGFFKEKSKGYKAMMAAEKVFRTFELAMSIRSMVQDALETTTSVANSAARATAAGTEGVAEQSKLPFPFNIAAMAATAAALVAAGVTLLGSGGGGGSKTPQTNTGTGTVLGDPAAQSESIKNAINALQDVNTTTSIYAREMAASLRSINNQIGGLASVLVRSGNIDASAGITEGFNKNFIGDMLSKIPLVGNLLGGLFGSKTTILGGGLYGGPQSLAEILSGGFDAQTYTDIKKKKKFFGVTTSTKYKTQYGEVDPALEQQFTMLLQSFNDAILAAAGPLGANTSEIAQRLQNFVLDIGKIDLKDLTGEEIEEKLQAVFGAAADSMAAAAFPGVLRFQQVGEGMFETLVRVASTVEAVTMSMNMLGSSVLSLDQAMGLADQFDNVSELTSAVGAYFEAFYSEEEQVAAKTAQMTKALNSMGLIMPDSLAGFRSLVEAQDLTTEAGRKAYAMLLQMAPAFADLEKAMSGAKSAADIAAERENLQRQIYQLVGNIEAIRALDLAKIDESNKALQQQVWAIQDAQEAAKAAQELRDAWSTVGDSIMDEVARIRGLSGQQTGANFATLMGQFNAATEAARAGDMDAAKDLPSLSQAMLAAAALMARSRQELDRVQTDTAASLEETNKAIQAYANGQQTDAQILDAANNTQQANSANANDNEVLRLSYEEMKSELAAMRADLVNGVTTLVNHAGKTRRILEDVTAASGGDAITTVYGAA